MEEIINSLKFDASGLIPAVVQNIETNEVLMVAYMNADTIRETAKTSRATFWSRSRQEVWVKGATSGNYMYVKEIRVDCDCDCLILLVNPAGAACHTGSRSCFFRKIEDGKLVEDKEFKVKSDIFEREQAVIIDRKANPEEGSYTNYLFDKGEDKILKKVGEEAAELGPKLHCFASLHAHCKNALHELAKLLELLVGDFQISFLLRRVVAGVVVEQCIIG